MVPEITDEQKEEWRKREQQRLTDGTYTELPRHWLCAIWFGNIQRKYHDHPLYGRVLEPKYPDHFAHVSIDRVAMIAFTESESKGVRDRQTRINPGKYLAKFFSDVLSKENIQYLATQMGAEYNDDADLCFAVTADEFEHVYTNGPGSCMSHHTPHFDSETHPVRVYAGFDLQLANLKRQDRITARALVWPEKKRFGRVYGDSVRLEKALTSVGYSSGTLHGAKITKLMEGDDYVIPYLDFLSGAFDRTTHLELSDGSNVDRKQRLCCNGDRQNGLSDDNGYRCDSCEEHVSEDNSHTYGDNTYCESCYSERYGYCERIEEDVPRDELEEVRIRRNASGGWRRQQWGEHARNEYAFFCQVDEVYYCSEHNEQYEVNSDTWGPDAFERHGITIDGEHFDKRDLPEGKFQALPESSYAEVQEQRLVLPIEAPQGGLHIRHEPMRAWPYKVFFNDLYLNGYTYTTAAQDYFDRLSADPTFLQRSINNRRASPLRYTQPAT